MLLCTHLQFVNPFWDFIRLYHLCSELVISPHHLQSPRGLDYEGAAAAGFLKVAFFLKLVEKHEPGGRTLYTLFFVSVCAQYKQNGNPLIKTLLQ